MRIAFLTLLFCGMLFAGKDETYERLKMLLDMLNRIKSEYVEEVDEKKLVYSAAKGMLEPLDPYSAFLEPRVYKEMQIETLGRYGGLGIRIALSEDGYIRIITAFPGTPAFKAGIFPDDVIIKIEGKDIKGITLEDAVKQLRGDPGTKVSITVRRGKDQIMDYTLTREEIKIPILRADMLTDKIGYIHLYEFNKETPQELRNALRDLRKKGMEQLIFDLRYNPGGLLEVAKEIAGLFIGDEKLIVYTDGRIPKSKREYRAPAKSEFGDIPMVVLVNRGSASGSEIVAGALQDYKRALIVGTTTFGKASVQSVYELPEGCALKLTTAKYYTPKGRLIEKDPQKGTGGIVPDIFVEVPPEIESKLRQADVYYPEKKETVREVKDPMIEKAIEIFKIYDLMKSGPQ